MGGTSSLIFSSCFCSYADFSKRKVSTWICPSSGNVLRLKDLWFLSRGCSSFRWRNHTHPYFLFKGSWCLLLISYLSVSRGIQYQLQSSLNRLYYWENCQLWVIWKRCSAWFMLFQKIHLKTLLDWRWWQGNFIVGLWAFKIVATSEGSCFGNNSERKMTIYQWCKVQWCTSEELNENLSRWEHFCILLTKTKQGVGYEKKTKKFMRKGQVCSPEIFRW